ncbi:MAG: ADP-forming succinate--CoA ligase subunit beta [Halothiobacillaceae bacterium]
MNLHEHQAKTLFAEVGIPVPPSALVTAEILNNDSLQRVLQQVAGPKRVVKAQVHSGARGKAGGVRLVEDDAATIEAIHALLGSRLVTHQTGPQGLPVQAVLVEGATAIARELYLAITVDRQNERVAVMASTEGGMEIEQVAEQSPEKLFRIEIHPATGLMPYQARALGFQLGLEAALVGQFVKLLTALYRLFVDRDAALVEINPLVVTDEGRLVALDAKLALDDNAAYRQGAMQALRDPAQEDERERAAAEHGLNYVSLDGNIACMVNGAGLAMATMDLIKLEGRAPANFLDVGGGTTAAKVAEAFKLILSDDKVAAILVNIFGGIVRCDLIAEGIIEAAREVQLSVPTVVRLEGTNAERGREMLAASGLNLLPQTDLALAAREAVARAGRP